MNILENLELRQKIRFVKDLSGVIAGKVDDVISVEYEVYSNNRWTQEFLIVNFSGFKCVRNCNGNSLSAIIKELGRLITGEYEDEVEYYERFIANPEFTKLEVRDAG